MLFNAQSRLNTHSMAARLLAGAAIFMSALLPVTAAHAAGLDGFLSGFRACDYADEGDPFERFVHSLAERYGNPFTDAPASAAERAEVAIVVPPELASAIGRPKSQNQGDHTLVTVPLKGSFGGLAVSRLEFAFGNENGINAATLVFSASRADVVKAFGASVARGNKKGEEQGQDGAGYSAEIPTEEPGRILCDWST